MGLTEKSTQVTYLSLGDGKVIKRVTEPTERSITRTTKEGKEVHEEHYPGITGYITDVKVVTHPQYGKFWNITIDDGQETFIVQTNYSGGYASTFLKALPNVDFSKAVTLSPYLKVKDGKKKVSLYINQNFKAVEWFFTKDNPNGLPPMVQVKVKGVLQWDDTAQNEFFEEYVKDKILPKLTKVVKGEGITAEPVKAKTPKEPIVSTIPYEDISDDLPF